MSARSMDTAGVAAVGEHLKFERKNVWVSSAEEREQGGGRGIFIPFRVILTFVENGSCLAFFTFFLIPLP